MASIITTSLHAIRTSTAAVFTAIPVRSAISLAVAVVLQSCAEPEFVNLDLNTLREENGKMLSEGRVLTGVVFRLNKSGDTILREEYQSGQPHGRWKNCYESGLLHEVRYFENGRKTGPYTVYWENGKRKEQTTFVNGEYQGNYREWNRSGTLIRSMTYENGHESGSQKLFYDNGSVRANYVVVNGRRFGLLGTKNCVNASQTVFEK